MSTVIFIHGAWVTPACWDNFIDSFTRRGYECIAPAWPRKDQSIEQLRADPSRLAGLGVQEIVDRYDGIIRDQPEPPMLVGHAFGGMFVQMLLDADQGTAVVLQLFDSADDMRAAEEAFDSMDASETPGTRASVDRCEVKLDMRVSE